MKAQEFFKKNKEKYKIKLIRQQDNLTCSIAAIAMLNGKNFNEIINQYYKCFSVNNYSPMSEQKVIKFLKFLKIKFIHQKYNSLFYNSIYMVTVPSFTRKINTHSIIIETFEEDYSKWKVYDPNNGYEKNNYYENFDLSLYWWNCIKLIKRS